MGGDAFRGCGALTEFELPETVNLIGREAFSDCNSLTSVLIPGSIKSIQRYAFSNCKMLTEAIFGEGASIVGDAMFHSCKMLRRVMFPASMREVSRNAFEYCEELTEICVAEDNTCFFADNGALIFRNSKELYLAPRGIKGHYEIPREVRSIGEEAFGGEHLGAGCSGMTDVTIPETVTQISARAFQCCDGLTNVTIPGSVTSVSEWAFSLCRNMSSVTLQEGVKEIGKNAFYRCDKLKKITIPASLAHIHSQAFSDCPQVESFDISPDNKALQQKNGVVFSSDGSRLLFCPGKLSGTYQIPDGVKEISVSAFENCRELKELVMPRGIGTLRDRMFYGCARLNKVTIYNDYPGDNIGRLFGYYTENSRDYQRPSCMVTIRDAQNDQVCFEVLLADVLRHDAWGKNGTFDFKILDEIFDRYKDIDNRIITAYLRLKYPIDLDGMIKDKYQSLIKRNGHKLFPDLIAEDNVEMIKDFLDMGAISKTKIGSMIETASENGKPEITALLMDYNRKTFGEKKPSLRLTDKPIEEWTVKKEAPGLVWRYNGKEKEVILPVEVNGVRITGIADTVLKKPENYLAIEKITIPEGYRTIGKDAFSGCRNLKEVVFSSTLETMGENCFFGCVSLKRIELPDALTNWGPCSFANCSALEEVRLPARVQRIPAQTFMQCEKLKEIRFPKGLRSIGNEAFRYCISLKEIDLGENFTTLGDKAFYMTKLETVIFRGEKCSASSGICFDYCI